VREVAHRDDDLANAHGVSSSRSRRVGRAPALTPDLD